MAALPDILVVDDDAHIRDVVRFALEQAGHRVREAADGRAALAAFAASPADLVVLDILMPELDGLEVCRGLRLRSEAPILFLSSRDEELDRVLGLEMGADDYVVKPFSPRELVARVKGILRRVERRSASPISGAQRVERGALCLDLDRHTASWQGQPLVFTVTEFGLVHTLSGNPDKVYTRDELVRQAYGGDHHVTDRTIDSHIRRIRKKFKALQADSIETVYGLGFRLVLEPEDDSA